VKHLDRRTRQTLLLVALGIQLTSAYALRWPLTNATLNTPVEYLLGQMVIASENWHREGALSRHFIPSRSIDQDFPEWGYRDEYWRDYLSQPPLSFMLHYWVTRAVPGGDPIVLARWLAEAQIAVAVLISGALLFEVFGAGATLAGLSFLLWGQPFLVWFIDGYYSTTTAMVCQLMLVSFLLNVYERELSHRSDAGAWPTKRRDLFTIAGLAYLGTLSEWVALFGSGIAVLAFCAVGVVFHRSRSVRARTAYAVAAAVCAGSIAAEVTTVVLYGTRIGFLYYWSGFTSRVDVRTGGSGFLAYTATLIRQMKLSWPPAMLAVLALMFLLVAAFAIVSLVKDTDRFRRSDGALLLLAMILGFGGAATYCYRLKNLVEVHWWFAGTWAIGWAVTVSAFGFMLGRLLGRHTVGARAGVYPAVCTALWVGAVGWNISFVDLRPPTRRWSHEMYRMIGAVLPRDGYPLMAVDVPDLFGDYPFTTAYLRRPVVRYNPSDDPDSVGDRLQKLGTIEDAAPDLLNRYGFPNAVIYVAYDGSRRQCAYEDVPLNQTFPEMALRVCRVRATTLLRNPDTLWSTSISTTAVSLAPGPGTFTVGVLAPSASTWSVENDSAFITVMSSTPVTGPGTATFRLESNPGFTRQSVVTVAGQSVRVTQAGSTGHQRCVTDVGVQEAWRATGGVRQAEATVTAPAGCVWVAATTAPWIKLAAASGSGNGGFRYTVATNMSAETRIGQIALGGRTATVTEWGCPYDLSSVTADVPAAGGTVRLTLTGQCEWRWTAVSERPFVQIASGSSGVGNGVVSLTVAANVGPSRVGVVTIAGYSVKINQGGS